MVKQELENIKVQEEEEEAKASSRAAAGLLLPLEGGELFDPGVDWDSLAAGFDLETLPIS